MAGAGFTPSQVCLVHLVCLALFSSSFEWNGKREGETFTVLHFCRVSTIVFCSNQPDSLCPRMHMHMDLLSF